MGTDHLNGKGTVPVNGNGTVPWSPKVSGSAGTEGGAHVGVVGERELAGLRGGDQG